MGVKLITPEVEFTISEETATVWDEGWPAMTPKFKHDCDRCNFRGRLDGMDAYVCADSVLLRFGDEGSEYLSMPKEMAVQEQFPNSQFNIAMRMGDGKP